MENTCKIRVLFSAINLNMDIDSITESLNQNFGELFYGRRVEFINSDDSSSTEQNIGVKPHNCNDDNTSDSISNIPEAIKKKIEKRILSKRNVDIKMHKSDSDISLIPSYFSTDGQTINLIGELGKKNERGYKERTSSYKLSRSYMVRIIEGKRYFKTVNSGEMFMKSPTLMTNLQLNNIENGNMSDEAYYFTADKFTCVIRDLSEKCSSMENKTQKFYYLDTGGHCSILGFKNKNGVQRITFYNPTLSNTQKTFIISKPQNAATITMESLWPSQTKSRFAANQTYIVRSTTLSPHRDECMVKTYDPNDSLELDPRIIFMTLAFGHFGHPYLANKMPNIKNDDFENSSFDFGLNRACQFNYIEAAKTFIQFLMNAKFSDDDDTSDQIKFNTLNISWEPKVKRDTSKNARHPLFMACKYCNTELAAFFVTTVLNSGFSDIEKVKLILPYSEHTKYDQPCLYMSCKYEHFDLVATLLKIILSSELSGSYQLYLLQTTKSQFKDFFWYEEQENENKKIKESKIKSKKEEKLALLPKNYDSCVDAHPRWSLISTNKRKKKIRKAAYTWRFGFFIPNHKLKTALKAQLLDI